MSKPSVVVFDYGSGNVHSVVRALAHVGAQVELTAQRDRARAAAGLLVPGVGNFHACMTGLRRAGGAELIEERVHADRPVLGICVGMQVMFGGSTEPSGEVPVQAGLGHWPGTVSRLEADIVPHMGWSTVTAAPTSRLFSGVADERFYFVHSYGVPTWESSALSWPSSAQVTWSEHDAPFLAAVEAGPLSATQFHPEKSGDAGLRLLKNWVMSL